MQPAPMSPPEQPFWQQPVATVLAGLGREPQGLTDGDATARRATAGPNVLRPPSQRALVVEFLAHFQNPLVLVLLGASGVSALLGDERSFVVITVIVLCSVTLDFVQELRAGRAAVRRRSGA